MPRLQPVMQGIFIFKFVKLSVGKSVITSVIEVCVKLNDIVDKSCQIKRSQTRYNLLVEHFVRLLE